MLKQIGKRYLSLLLTLVLLLALVPAMELPALADDFTVSGTFSYSNFFDVAATGTSGQGSVLVSSGTFTLNASYKSGTCGGSDCETTLTLTPKVALDTVTVVGTSVTGKSYSCTVKGSSLSSGSSTTVSMSTSDKIIIKISSNGSSATGKATLAISNVTQAPVSINTTFKAPVNGSYTVDGTQITSQTTLTKLSTQSYALVAAPATNHSFLGWFDDEGTCLSTSASYTYYGLDTHTVWPVFYKTGNAVFYLKGTPTVFYDYMNTAISAANSGSGSNKTIVVYKSGNVGHSDGSTKAFTIPNGVTLLVPYDATAASGTTPTVVASSSPAKTTTPAFRKLTLPAGTSITLQKGAVLNVYAKVSKTQLYSGMPTSTFGQIDMAAGSTIIAESGAVIYAYGYITGNGTVTVENGATIHEMFEFNDFRGGTEMSGFTSYQSKKVFPFSQYYVANVEAYLVIEKGGTETVHSYTSMSGGEQPMSFNFVGTSSAMFLLTSKDSYLKKWYSPTEDRIIIEVSGDSSLAGIKTSFVGQSINSSDYVLPINGNMTINVASGNLTISQDVKLLPGTVINIENGSTVMVASGSKLYLYDSSEWGGYCTASDRKLMAQNGSPTRADSNKRTADDLIDVELNVNGTLIIQGQLYTTASGANITSSLETGFVKFESAFSSSTLYERMQAGSSWPNISITSAQLHNKESTGGAYVLTAERPSGTTTYRMSNGVWAVDNNIYYNVTFDSNGGSSVNSAQVVSGQTVSMPTDPTKENFVFAGWYLVINGTMSNTQYDFSTPVTGDITLKAKWTSASSTQYTVTVQDDGHGTGSASPSSAPVGMTITLSSTPSSGYEFDTWEVIQGDILIQNNSFEMPEENVVVKAQFKVAHVHSYGEPTFNWNSSHTSCVVTFTCGTCSEGTTGHVVTVTDVSITSDTNGATCTETGNTIYTATVTAANSPDGVAHSDVQTVEIAALGHDYEAVVTAPTCTEGGYTTYTCSRCGDSYTDSETAALGHSFGEWVVTTAATCETDGVETRTCSRCGDTETQALPALGHVWGTPTWTWSADHTNATATFTCTRDTSHTREIAASGDAITVNTSDPTKNVYTATISFEGETYTNTVEVSAYAVITYQPGRAGGESYTQSVTPGELTPLTVCAFEAPGGYRFHQWIGSNEKVYKDGENARFYESVILTAQWEPVSDSTAITVNWRDDLNNGIIIRTDYLENVDNLAQPTVPTHDGYSFAGWQVMRGSDVFATISQSAITRDLIISTINAAGKTYTNADTFDIFAVFSETTPKTVTILYKLADNNAVPISSESAIVKGIPDGINASGQFQVSVGRYVHLIAAAEYTDGSVTYEFVHWAYGSETLAKADILVRPTDNLTLTAVYKVKEGSTAAEEAVFCDMSDISCITENGVKKIRATMSFSLPEGYTAVRAGMYRNRVESTVSGHDPAFLKDTATSGTFGEYTIYVSSKSNTFGFYFCAYLEYKDDEGNTQYAYGERTYGPIDWEDGPIDWQNMGN